MIEMTDRAGPDNVPLSSPEVPRRPSRVVGVDAARGVALLGMIAVHGLLVADEAGRPTWSYLIFGGRASAAFAVVAGIAMAFLTGRRRVRRPDGLATAAAIAVRALAVGVVGLALGYTDGGLAVVILPAFAMMYLLMIPLVFLPTWAVAVAGVIVAAGGPALSHVLLPGLPAPALDNPGFADFVRDPGGVFAELLFTGQYPALPWLTYLCTGLVVGRLSLTGVNMALGLLATGVLLANAASTASSMLLHRYGGLAQIMAAVPDSGLTAAQTGELLTLGGDGTTPTSTWWWLAIDTPHTSTPLDLVGTTGSALALVGAMLLAGCLTGPVLRRLAVLVRTPLAAAGGMPLTLYTAHIVFINSGLDVFDPLTGFVLQAGVALVVAFVWRGTGGRGPLEAAVSWLSNAARRRVAAAFRRPPLLCAQCGAPVLVGQATDPERIADFAGSRQSY